MKTLRETKVGWIGKKLGSNTKQWDEAAIDQVFENLLDELGGLVDQITLLGCYPTLQGDPVLNQYLCLVQHLEKELLQQWSLKQDKGLEALFSNQKHWLQRELRKTDGFFHRWNALVFLLWDTRSKHSPIRVNLWQNHLLTTMLERSFWASFDGGFATDQAPQLRQKIGELLRLFYELDPYHQVLSFLNLIEIGNEYRPEILQIGNLENKPMGANLKESEAWKELLDKIESGQWNRFGECLKTYWEFKTPDNRD